MAISFKVSDWSGWTTAEIPPSLSSVVASSPPNVSHIPALLRRRLNSMGKACAATLYPHLENHENTPIVFCSRHGDIDRTLGVLIDLTDDEPVSPMHFSLTVHNAITGIISIHHQVTGNISSIAATRGAIVPVLLEAIGQLNDNCHQVHCLICDFPLPEIYQDAETPAIAPFTVSFTVTAGTGTALTLEQKAPEATPLPDAASTDDDPLAFISFLASAQQTLNVDHNGSRWSLSKRHLT